MWELPRKLQEKKNHYSGDYFTIFDYTHIIDFINKYPDWFVFIHISKYYIIDPKFLDISCVKFILTKKICKRLIISKYGGYFFEDLITLINRTDKTYEFFEKIPETQGFFPILTVERTLLRKEKSRTYVANITKQQLSDNKFKIPTNYQLVNN